MDTFGRYFGGKPSTTVGYGKFVALCWFRLVQVLIFIWVAFYSGNSLTGIGGNIVKIGNTMLFAGLNGYL